MINSIFFCVFLFLYVISPIKDDMSTVILSILLLFCISDIFKLYDNRINDRKNVNDKLTQYEFKFDKREENKVKGNEFEENKVKGIEIDENKVKGIEIDENKVKEIEDEDVEENDLIRNTCSNIISLFHLKINQKEYNDLYILLLNAYKHNPNNQICDYLTLIFHSRNIVDTMKKLDIATYIVWNSYNQEQIDSIYEKIVEMSSDNSYNNKIRANAIDILMRSNNKKYLNRSTIVLERLRQEERNEDIGNNIHRIRGKINNLRQHVQTFHFPAEEDLEIQQVIQQQIQNLQRQEHNIIANQDRKQSVYTDTQNVHNHEINESVLNVASSLLNSKINSSSGVYNIEEELKQNYPDYEKQKNQITISLERIKSDPSKFRGDMTLSTVFDKVVGVISSSLHKKEMTKRLGEELNQMSGLCTTGHLSRLINVIQGFDIKDELKVKINIKDEVYANIQTYLSSQIQKADTYGHDYEQLMDDMVDSNFENRKRFLDFVAERMKPKVKELEKDYKDITDSETLRLNIEDSLINYLKNEQDVKIIMNQI